MNSTTETKQSGFEQGIKNISLLGRIKLALVLAPRIWKFYKIQKVMFNHLQGHLFFTFTKLGIADYLQDRVCSVDDIAKSLQLNPAALDLLLQSQAKAGFLKKIGRDLYGLTKMGQYLRADNDNSFSGSIHSMGEVISPAWLDLDYSIRTGQSSFEKRFGAAFYDYLSENPRTNTHFTQWMAETIREWIIPTLDSLAVGKVDSIVDVGGNSGELMVRILQRYPQMQGRVFDRPHVDQDAQKVIAQHGLQQRCEFVGGSFFESVPAGAELYTLSRVLDNWDDEHALKILQTVRKAMSATAKLIICDNVHPEQNLTNFAILGSLQVLAMGKGVIRTEKQFNQLLVDGGFKALRIVKTGGPCCFIEAMVA